MKNIKLGLPAMLALAMGNSVQSVIATPVDESENIELLRQVFPQLSKKHTKPRSSHSISQAELNRFVKSINKPKRAHKDRHKKGRP
jgi:hypothetical protein